MEESRKDFMLAAAVFRALPPPQVSVPSGIAGDEAVLRLRQAGETFRRALDVYIRAMRDFDDFLKNGKLPTRSAPSTQD
jgi:hypothetical protein